MEIPLITYLVSPVPQAFSRKNDPLYFFHIPAAPWTKLLYPLVQEIMLCSLASSLSQNVSVVAYCLLFVNIWISLATHEFRGSATFRKFRRQLLHPQEQQASRIGDPRPSEQPSSPWYSTHGPTQRSKRRFKAPVSGSSTAVSHPLARAYAQQSWMLHAKQHPDRLTWSPQNANRQHRGPNQQIGQSPSHTSPRQSTRARESPPAPTHKRSRFSRPPKRSRAKLRCPPRSPEGAEKP